jgi:hypothetical protein
VLHFYESGRGRLVDAVLCRRAKLRLIYGKHVTHGASMLRTSQYLMCVCLNGQKISRAISYTSLCPLPQC